MAVWPAAASAVRIADGRDRRNSSPDDRFSWQHTLAAVDVEIAEPSTSSTTTRQQQQQQQQQQQAERKGKPRPLAIRREYFFDVLFFFQGDFKIKEKIKGAA